MTRQHHVSAAVLKDHLGKPICVERVKFDYVSRTQYDALTAEVNQLFNVSDVGELLKLSAETAKRMKRDGLFETVDVRMNVAKTPKTCRKDSVPIEINFVVDEPQFIRASVNAGVTNRGESQLGAEAGLSSVFGRGEKLTVGGDLGNRKSSLFNVSFVKPLLGGRETRIGLHASRTYYQWPWNSLCGLETGLAADLIHSTFGDALQHVIRFQSDWREVGCLARTTPFYVREQAGHSLKNSIKNIITYSTEDSATLARKGVYAKVLQDFAGITGGDVDALKHEFVGRFSFPILADVFASVSLQAKHVMPLNSSRMAVIDRVFLGGQNDLRGFAYYGVGPVSDGAFVGAMGSWAAAFHIYKPLIPKRFFFAHAFAAAGNVSPFGANKKLNDIVQDFTREPRLSLGVGLAVKLADMARLELNYCVPISNHPSDVKQPGLQFGVGVSFL